VKPEGGKPMEATFGGGADMGMGGGDEKIFGSLSTADDPIPAKFFKRS